MRTSRMLCLVVPLMLLAAAAPSHATTPPPPPTEIYAAMGVAPPDVSTYTPTFTDAAVIRVAQSVTAKWDAYSSSVADFTMCLRGESVHDTLRVEASAQANDCTFGSARSSYRQSCTPTVTDWSAFDASGERLRFTICAPGKAFVLLKNPTSTEPRVSTRRGT